MVRKEPADRHRIFFRLIPSLRPGDFPGFWERIKRSIVGFAQKRHPGWIIGGMLGLLLAVGLVKRAMNWASLRGMVEESKNIYVQLVNPEAVPAAIPLELPGTTQGFYETPIWGRVSGYVKSWYHDIGERVKEGDLLCEIDAPEVDHTVSNLRAKADIARINYERWKALVRTRAVSQEEYDVQRTGYEAALAELNRWIEWQKFEKVTAPFSGVITARNIDVGTLIAGQGEFPFGAMRQLFRMAEISLLRIYVAVPQAYAFAIREGMLAKVAIPEMPKEIRNALVVRTAMGLEPASRTLLTEVDLPNPDQKLLPGLYVLVTFAVPSRAPFVLPVNTVFDRGDGHYVLVVDAGDRCHLRKVDLGNNDGYKVEILSGIQAGERVILSPPDRAKVEGATVTVVSTQEDR
ncbi:Nickel and cobalt resistance protein CnrB [Methylacidimicrobium cyclopophantes]|uniref:Nickel and cobalt resistance protein CnrB n=1 Tax=Methylacidimicrobium cyclopophantes TaxID=1041766 RepID=A0A5E6M721_9BACT|nr:efflux RND transporter periplasmic adaptor subunit [Methylacidimicrobium cyclopophantes]VVM05167.1 Nickel and cobalt resistance protein CnrB [Methylacidimicrobium cyclopophantes]